MKKLHRILTPIISLLIFPAAFFLPLFRIVVSSGAAGTENRTNIMTHLGLGEFISLKDIIAISKDGNNEGLNFIKNFWQALKPENRDQFLKLIHWQWGAVFAVIFVIILVLALALIIVSIVSKKTGVSIILSGVGIVLTAAMNGCFNLFAKPFLSGAVNLNSILGNTEKFTALLLGNAMNFDYMKLSTAYPAIMFIFLSVFIFSIIIYFEQKNEN